MNNELRNTDLINAAKKAESSWKQYYSKNKKKLISMDIEIHHLHDKISKNTNCLECANCCRTLGPRLTDKDIDRISKTLKLKAAYVIEKHIRIDEDGDMVFKEMPCPFLGIDNYCSIYEARPKACREYPHTDRKRFFQIFELSIKNAYTCPIVFGVLQELTKNNTNT